MDFFHHQHVIYQPFLCHPWKPHVNPTHSFVGVGLYVPIYWNYMLSTINNTPLCWVILLDHLCGPFRLAMPPTRKGTLNTLPPSLHTT